VQGHERRLNAEARDEEDEGGLCEERVGVREAGDAARGEGGGAGHRGDHNRPREDGDAAAEGVGQVFAAGCAGLRRLVVGDERVRRHRQEFVEDEDGDEVVGEGDAEGGGDGRGKGREVAGLGVFGEPAHVADAVETRDEPEEARDGPEEEAERVGLEREFDAGHQGAERGDVRRAGDCGGEHAGDDGERARRREDGPALADVRPTAGGEDRYDGNRRDGDGQSRSE